jgi:hypothetical protein
MAGRGTAYRRGVVFWLLRVLFVCLTFFGLFFVLIFACNGFVSTIRLTSPMMVTTPRLCGFYAESTQKSMSRQLERERVCQR